MFPREKGLVITTEGLRRGQKFLSIRSGNREVAGDLDKSSFLWNRSNRSQFEEVEE